VAVSDVDKILRPDQTLTTLRALQALEQQKAYFTACMKFSLIK
jgi:hypothetical protein